jgi:hypothetical protein
VNKLEDVRVHFLAFDIMLFLSNLVLLQSDIVMILTGTLSHLCKMNNIARYITTSGLKSQRPVANSYI